MHQTFERFLGAGFACGGNLAFALLHAFITRDQQRLGLGVFLLPAQTAT